SLSVHILSLQPTPDHRAPHSFPTRRSSDLDRDEQVRRECLREARCDAAAETFRDCGRTRRVDVLEQRLTAARSERARHGSAIDRSEEHTSELQSLAYLVCRLLLEK